MSLFSQILAVVTFMLLFSGILLVIFGQVTVRKLRNDPETRDKLGVEFASGWDIINVAQALAMPRILMKRLNESPLSLIHANAEILHKNTNKLDRVLAIIFYWIFVLSGLSAMLLVFVYPIVA